MADTEQLVVPLVAKVDDFERNFKRAGRTAVREFDAIEKRSKLATDRLEGNMSAMAGKLAGIGKSMAAGLVAGFIAGGVAGIAGQVSDVVRGIAEVGDEAKRAGLGIEAFQELKYVAEQNRIGVDALTDGIKELNLRADEFIVTGGGSAAEAFARLGYNAETLKTKLKDPSALFTEIIGKLGQLDRAAQIRIADEIFGGSGGEQFVQLIEQGEDALNRTRQEAHDLGIVMDDELIARADELDRQFNALANTVGSALKSAIVEAAAALSDFIGRFQAFEARGTAMLERNMTELGAERLDVENRILTINSSIRQSGGENPAGEANMRDAIGVLSTRMGEISSEESRIMGILADRKPAEPPAQTGGGPLKILVEGATTIQPPAPAVSHGGGGGGASAMREQRDAAADLIAKLEEELRVIGMSDVEQRINAELRRAGAGATDDQKGSIRELVTQIDTETAAMGRLEQASENAKGIAKDFLGGLIGDLRSGVDGATALANAFGRLADKLIDMALDSLIDSLFSSLLSGAGGGGGFLGGLLGFSGGGVVEAATGGLIHGPGTGTSDSIPARLSNGEFVVNAGATRRNMALLHALNDGSIAGFASGGLAGSDTLRGANLNIGHANDNAAPVFQISAPITVNGSAGTPEQNSDLAAKMARSMESSMRGVVSAEISKQMRPGNTLNTRGR